MAVRFQAPLSAYFCHRSLPPHSIHPLLLRTTSIPRGRCWSRTHPSTSTAAVPRRTLLVSAMAKRGSSFSREVEIASPEDLRFVGPLKIVEYPDPVLRARNKRVGTFDENLKRLAEEMFDVMYKTDGIGLSAPQVGLNIQLMVFNPVGVRGEGEEVILVNPRIYKFSKKITLFDEGCLSFPEIYGDVERPVSVKIDAQDITGTKFSISLSGLPARVFQHEFDHLEGTLFFERMDNDVLDNVRSQLRALEKKYEDQTGMRSPESIDNYRTRRVAVGFAK